jgi:hypothetical protein
VLDRQAGRDVVDAAPIVGWWRLAAVVEDHASRRRVGGRHDGRRGQGAVLDVARHAAPSAPALVPTTIRAGSSRTGASTSSAPYSYAPRAPPPDSTIPIVPSVASTLSRPDRARGRRPTGTHADRRRCLRGFDPAIQRFVHGGSPCGKPQMHAETGSATSVMATVVHQPRRCRSGSWWYRHAERWVGRPASAPDERTRTTATADESGRAPTGRLDHSCSSKAVVCDCRPFASAIGPLQALGGRRCCQSS